PLWRRRVERLWRILAGRTVAGLPEIVADEGLSGRIARVVLAENGIHVDEAPRELLAHFLVPGLASALGLALHRSGFGISYQPGEAIQAKRDAETVSPYLEIEALVTGADPPSAWEERYARRGVGALPLEAVSSKAS